MVHRPEDEDDQECVASGLLGAHPNRAHHGHRQQAEEHQHHPNDLSEPERVWDNRDLLRVHEVHNSDGELLEDSRENWCRNIDDPGPITLDDHPLHPLQRDILLSRCCLEVLQARRIDTAQVQVRKVRPVEIRDVTHAVAEEQAHQPREDILKLLDLCLLCWIRAAERNQVTDAIQPHPACALDQGDPFPVTAVGMLSPEDDQESNHVCNQPPCIYLKLGGLLF
mmetsp:Transcript_115910/g.334737  ORF Transcript_115910/g.334737 Transcript_115910/m.334737 type:complete len:224 (-) Transcript_115910:208-879(-)